MSSDGKHAPKNNAANFTGCDKSRQLIIAIERNVPNQDEQRRARPQENILKLLPQRHLAATDHPWAQNLISSPTGRCASRLLAFHLHATAYFPLTCDVIAGGFLRWRLQPRLACPIRLRSSRTDNLEPSPGPWIAQLTVTNTNDFNDLHQPTNLGVRSSNLFGRASIGNFTAASRSASHPLCR